MMSAEKEPIPLASNFIRAIVEKDLEQHKFAAKKWAARLVMRLAKPLAA